MTKQTSPTSKASRTVVRRHPFRGAFWGLLLGSGITLHLLGFGVVAFGAWPLLAAPVASAIGLGLAWGLFGPARKLQRVLPPARRVATTSDERRSPAEVRAAQILAARQANEDLHDIATADEDGAMSAALHEAEKDAVKVASPAARQLKAKSTRDTSSQQAPRTRHAERLEPVAATPAELFTATEPSVADAPEVVVPSSPLAEDVAPAGIPEPKLIPEMLPSPPLSLTSEPVTATAAVEAPLPAPLAEAPIAAPAPLSEPVPSPPLSLAASADQTPIAAPSLLSEPVPSPPLSLPAPAHETPTAAPTLLVEPATGPPLSLTGGPAPALATPVPPLPGNPPSELIVEATAEPVAQIAAEPVAQIAAEPVAQIAAEPVAEIAAPTVTTAQDLTPFENSPLPNGADEEQLAAEKLEAQLDAALREALAVTSRNS